MSPRAVLAVAAVLAACTGTDDVRLGSSTSAVVDPADFVLPSPSDAERATIVHKYNALDTEGVVPRGLLEDAILFYDINQPLIPNQAYLIVVDLSLYSGDDRFWMVDLTSGAVEPHKVAHGDGSDPDNDGYATKFGNVSGSHMSSLGFYLTGEIYDGTHPHSMRLDGLSPDGSPNGMANTNVRDRLIVVHEASYVDDSNASQQGRSNGCLALDTRIEAGVVDRIHDGSLIYAATGSLFPPVGPGTDPPPGGDGIPPDDPPADDPGDPGVGAGCSTSGSGSSFAFALGLAGIVRVLRQRRRMIRC